MTATVPTPASGTISIANIKAAFLNTVNSNDLNAYRGATYYVPGTGTTGTFPAGQISLSDFYNKIDLQVPILQTQQIDIAATIFPSGGCAGGGYKGMNYRVSAGVAYLYCGGYYADYGSYGSTAFNTSYGGQMFAANIGVSTSTNSRLLIGAGGRDTMVVAGVQTWNGTALSLQIYGNCKGGTYPTPVGGFGWGLLATITPAISWVNPT